MDGAGVGMLSDSSDEHRFNVVNSLNGGKSRDALRDRCITGRDGIARVELPRPRRPTLQPPSSSKRVPLCMKDVDRKGLWVEPV